MTLKRNSKKIALILTIIFSLSGIHGIGNIYLKKYKIGLLFFTLTFMPLIVYFSYAYLNLWIIGYPASTLLEFWSAMFERGLHQKFMDSEIIDLLIMLDITLLVMQIIYICRMQLKYKQDSLF